MALREENRARESYRELYGNVSPAEAAVELEVLGSDYGGSATHKDNRLQHRFSRTFPCPAGLKLSVLRACREILHPSRRITFLTITVRQRHERLAVAATEPGGYDESSSVPFVPI